VLKLESFAELSNPEGSPVWWGGFADDGSKITYSARNFFGGKTIKEDTLHVWDIGKRKDVATAQWKGLITDAAFAPGQPGIAAVGCLGDYQDAVLKYFDRDTLKEQSSIVEPGVGQAGIPERVVFVPDGSGILIARKRPEIELWKLPLKKCSRTFAIDPPSTMPLADVAVAGGAKFVIAVGGSDPKMSSGVYLWEIDTGRQIYGVEAGPKAIKKVFVAPDGLRAILFRDTDSTITLWDIAEGKSLKENKRRSPISGAFTPDGKFFLCAYVDGTLAVLNAATLETVNSYKEHKGPIFFTAISPRGDWVATGDTFGIIRIWKCTTEP
jgi:WD40 repeat protein